MKNNSFHITALSLWLSLQILLGSVGLPIIEHYCEMSRIKSTSVIEAKKCCCEISDKKFAKIATQVEVESSCSTESSRLVSEQEDEKEGCCNTQTTYEQADFEATEHKSKAFSFKAVFIAFQSSFFVFSSHKSFLTLEKVLHFADLPPPNWKLDKLFIVFIQVFRW